MNTLVSPPHEYKVDSTDEDCITATADRWITSRNVRVYKVTAKAFGIAKVVIHDGDLQDVNQWGDFVQVEVLPNPSDVPYASWYAEVVPGIMRGLRASAKSGGPTLENKAGFLLAQAFSEQSPSKGDPSDHNNRLFNVQALVTWDSARHMKVVPGQTETGVSLKDLSQGEGATDKTRVDRVSPTFVYDSPERAVTHYLKVMPKRYAGVYRVITTASATFAQFAQALQDAPFATDEEYAAKLRSNSFQAIKYAQKWVTFQMHVLADELAKTTDDARVNALKEELELLRDAQEQFKNFR